MVLRGGVLVNVIHILHLNRSFGDINPRYLGPYSLAEEIPLRFEQDLSFPFSANVNPTFNFDSNSDASSLAYIICPRPGISCDKKTQTTGCAYWYWIVQVQCILFEIGYGPRSGHIYVRGITT